MPEDEEKTEHQKEFEETLKRMIRTSKEEFERQEVERKTREAQDREKESE